MVSTARCFVLAASFATLGCGGSPPLMPDSGTHNDAQADAAEPPLKLTFPGVGTGGVFDPSMTRDPATSKLWMSYSAVNKSGQFSTINTIAPHTRLAFSIDNGETWTDAGAVNQISDVALPLAPPNNAGTWVNEVSTLMYDPSAPSAQRWKLMWNTFLKIGGVGRFEHSWLAIKMAATPEQLATAPAVKLFTSYLYDIGNSSAATPTKPPIATGPAIQLDTTVVQLDHCLVSEPSLLATPAKLYLALQCEHFASNTQDDREVVLLSCASPCTMTDPSQWTFVSRVFDKAKSAALDPANAGFAAPALVTTDHGTFLLVTPTREPGTLYRGCWGFEIANLDTGTLVGVPTVVVSLDGTPDKFNGACAYLGGAASGILRSEYTGEPDNEFQIYMTRVAM